MLCLEQPATETAPLFIGTTTERADIERLEDEDAAHQFIERDYANADYAEFCQQARACAVVPLSDAELIRAYARHTHSQSAADDYDEWAERDRLEEQQRIAGEHAEYTSGISSHVAFRKAHDFLDGLEMKSRRTYHCADFAADLNLAAFHALRHDLTAWAFYQLWASGAAAGIPAHILARSQMWYRVRVPGG